MCPKFTMFLLCSVLYAFYSRLARRGTGPRQDGELRLPEGRLASGHPDRGQLGGEQPRPTSPNQGLLVTVVGINVLGTNKQPQSCPHARTQ
jgi:hypothetical protein